MAATGTASSGGDGMLSLAGLRPGDHVCYLYETEEEHRELLTPYLCHGLARNERVAYIADTHTAEQVLEYLRQEGLDTEGYQRRGQLTVLGIADTYLRTGVFEPDAMIELLRTEEQRALADGYAGLRATGETSWTLRGLAGGERLMEYEAKLNLFFPGSKVIGLCQYDRRVFSPDLLLHALRTHPLVVLGTQVLRNPCYLPPEEPGGTGPGAAELTYRLDGIRRLGELEHRLQAANAALIEAQAVARIGSWGYDVAADQPTWSLEMYRLFHQNPALPPPHREERRAWFHPDDWPRVNAAVQAAMRDGTPYDEECRLPQPDGTIVWAHVSGRAERDASGAVVRLFGTVQDITERKQAELALGESERRFRAIADYTYDWEVWVGTDGRLRWTNPAVTRVTGYSVAEVMAMADFPAPLVAAADQAWVLADFHQVVKGEVPLRQHEFRIRRKDGRVIWAEVVGQPIRDEQGRAIGSRASIRDITARKETELVLRASEERFRELFNHTRSGVVIYRATAAGDDFVFADLNAAAEQMDQSRREALLGRSVLEVFPGVRAFGLFEVFQRVWRTGCPEQHPVSLYHDGRIAGWRTNYVFRLPSGEVVAIYEDVTKERQAEEQLRGSLAEKTALLEEIHHRVKNNLQIVTSLLNLQAAQTTNQRVLETLRDTQSRVRAMALLHETLYGSGDLARVNFAGYVELLCAQLFRAYGVDAVCIRLAFRIESRALTMDQAVPCGLIINELVTNALKYAFPCGRAGQITVSLQAAAEHHLALSVADDGVGLPPGFDLRQTTRLGLQLVSSLAGQLGGALEVVPGTGNTVRVRFPEKPAG